VLVGFVRSEVHLAWIRAQGLYNLRGEPSRGGVGLDGVELAAAWVLLYGSGKALMELYRVTGQPELHTKESVLALGCPGPGGGALFLSPLRQPGGDTLDGTDSPSAAGCVARAREAGES
jgi:hypothetical protein